MRPLDQLFKQLGYTFADIDLARAALTHRSAGGQHNERMEFLGDALLDLVIAEQLFLRLPDANEGDLSRLRASLVRRGTLAKVAADLEIGEYMTLGTGELRSGGFRRASILADAMEAILGAIYLEGGFAAASDCVQRLYRERLDNLPDPQKLLDPKTRLQEYLQARGLQRPDYTVVEVTGEQHRQHFRVSCTIAGLNTSGEGSGSSRRRAEQAAADAVFERLHQDQVS